MVGTFEQARTTGLSIESLWHPSDVVLVGKVCRFVSFPVSSFVPSVVDALIRTARAE